MDAKSLPLQGKVAFAPANDGRGRLPWHYGIAFRMPDRNVMGDDLIRPLRGTFPYKERHFHLNSKL